MQVFSPSSDLAPSPPPPSVSSTARLRRQTNCWRERRRGWGRSQIIRWRESSVRCKSFNTQWSWHCKGITLPDEIMFYAIHWKHHQPSLKKWIMISFTIEMDEPQTKHLPLTLGRPITRHNLINSYIIYSTISLSLCLTFPHVTSGHTEYILNWIYVFIRPCTLQPLFSQSGLTKVILYSV